MDPDPAPPDSSELRTATPRDSQSNPPKSTGQPTDMPPGRSSHQLIVLIREKAALSRQLESEIAVKSGLQHIVEQIQTGEQSLRAKCDRLSSELSDAQTAYGKLKFELDLAIAEKKRTERAHVTEVESLKTDLQCRGQRAASEAESSLREKRRLESEIKLLQSQNAVLNDQIVALAQRISEHERGLQGLKRERDESARKLQEVTQNGSKEMNLLKAEVNRLVLAAQATEQLKQQLVTVGHEKRELKTHLAEVENQLDGFQQRFSAIQRSSQGKLEDAYAEIASLKARNLELQESRDDQKRGCAEFTKLIGEIQRNLEPYASEEPIPETIAELIRMLESSRKGEEKSKVRCQKLEHEIDELKGLRSQLQGKVQQLTDVGKGQERELDRQSSEVARLQKRIAEEHQIVASSDGEIERQRSEIEVLTEKIDGKDIELKEKERIIRDLQKRQDTANSEASHHENAVTELKGRLDAAEREALDLKGKIDELKDENIANAAELSKSNADKARLEAQLQQSANVAVSVIDEVQSAIRQMVSNPELKLDHDINLPGGWQREFPEGNAARKRLKQALADLNGSVEAALRNRDREIRLKSQEVAELKAQLGKLEGRETELGNIVESAGSANNSLNERFRKLHQQYEAVCDRLKEAERANADLNGVTREQNGQVEAFQTRVKAQQRELESREQQIADLTDQNDELKHNLDEKTKATERVEQACKSLKTDNARLRNEKAQVSDQLKQQIERFDKVSRKRKFLKEQKRNADNECKSVAARLETTKSRLDQTLDDVEKRKQQLTSRDAEINRLTEQIEASARDTDRQLREMQKTAAERNRLGEELEINRENTDHIVTQLSTAMNNLSRAQKEIQSQALKVASLAGEISNMSNLNSLLKDENQSLKKSLEEATTRNAHENDEEITALRAEQAKLVTELAETSADNALKSGKIAELRAALEDQHDTLAAAQKEVEENIELSNACQALQDEVGKSRARQRELESKLDAYESYSKGLDEKIADLNRELAEAQQDRDTREKEIERLREKLGESERMMESWGDCTAKLSKANEALEKSTADHREKLEARLAAVSTKCDSLTADNSKLTQEVQSLSAVRQDLEHELDLAKSQFSSNLNEARLGLTSSKEDIKRLRRANGNLTRRAGEVVALKRKLKQVSAELAESRDNNDHLVTQLTELTETSNFETGKAEELNILREAIESLEGENEAIRRSLRSASRSTIETDDLDGMPRSHRRLREISGFNDSLHDLLERSHVRNQELVGEIYLLRKQVVAHEKETQKQKRQIDELAEENGRLLIAQATHR